MGGEEGQGGEEEETEGGTVIVSVGGGWLDAEVADCSIPSFIFNEKTCNTKYH
jgi:hypothetical protein